MPNRIKNILNQIEHFLLCAIVFVFPMDKRVIPIVIATYCGIFVLNGGIPAAYRVIKSKYLFFTTAYYAILLIGIFNSSQINAAWFDVEVKFSLLLFPFIFSARSLTRKQFSDILVWFIIGCLIATIICLTVAVFYYFDTYDESVFYYQEVSIFQHPSYFSMYLNFCIYVIYYFMVYDKQSFKIQSDVLSVIIIVIFSLFVVLLSSKIGLITLFMVIFTGTIMWFLRSRAIFPSLIVFTMLTSLIYISFNYSSYIQGRLEEAVFSLSDERVTFTTTGARVIIWKIGIELIKEKPLLGYGTGDVKSELINKYDEKGFSYLAGLKLNAHNQYLQMLIAIGILGSVFFWLYLYYPVLAPGFFKNMLYMGLITLISFNFLTESMLETQAGVVFYAFFNAMFFFNMNNVVPISFKKKI
ncbi:MAG TPA: hypothetical protein DCX54_09010 [Flavobacteriales bacterium]|nr:hypothetical protein [Flavobacteriales bacterium]